MSGVVESAVRPVYDQSRAVVPGTEVTLIDVKTNIRARSVLTDDHGNYETPELKPGTYRLTAVSSGGFKTFVAENIALESGQVRRVDVVLEIGEQMPGTTCSIAAAPKPGFT